MIKTYNKNANLFLIIEKINFKKIKNLLTFKKFL